MVQQLLRCVVEWSALQLTRGTGFQLTRGTCLFERIPIELILLRAALSNTIRQLRGRYRYGYRRVALSYWVLPLAYWWLPKTYWWL